MIKISRYIYIHPLTVALFAVCYITRRLGMLACVYGVMLLHEASHAAAALYLGVGVSRFVLYPFGVNLKIKTRLLSSVADEMILYLSGPLVNALAALVCALAGVRNIFYYNNILLFVINMLPVLPLDGGQLARRFIAAKAGEKRAYVILRFSGGVAAFVFLWLMLKFGGISLNSITFAAFLIVSVFAQKEKYSRDFVREIAYTANRRKPSRAEIILAEENADRIGILRNVVPSKGAVVFFTDSNSKIVKTATDTEIANEILVKNSRVN